VPGWRVLLQSPVPTASARRANAAQCRQPAL